MAGTADAVLYIRALHNLARFEPKEASLSNAFKETYTVLKPGGIVGIVQHQAREDRPDDWANGDNGYLKKSFLVSKMQDAGFEFVGESNINENPRGIKPYDIEVQKATLGLIFCTNKRKP